MTHNPAIAAEPAEPSEHTYRVTARSRVLGHEPGEEFTATLPLAQAARLVASGALAVADPLGDMQRPELNSFAIEHGVDPDALPNKQAVIDAINAHNNPEEPDHA